MRLYIVLQFCKVLRHVQAFEHVSGLVLVNQFYVTARVTIFLQAIQPALRHALTLISSQTTLILSYSKVSLKYKITKPNTTTRRICLYN